MNPTRLLVTVPNPDCTSRIKHLLDAQAPGSEVLCAPNDCSQAAQCRWLEELPPRQLGEVQALLSEAVTVLERSRQAFKSAQLAQLRRTLTSALKNLSDNSE